MTAFASWMMVDTQKLICFYSLVHTMLEFQSTGISFSYTELKMYYRLLEIFWASWIKTLMRLLWECWHALNEVPVREELV